MLFEKAEDASGGKSSTEKAAVCVPHAAVVHAKKQYSSTFFIEGTVRLEFVTVYQMLLTECHTVIWLQMNKSVTVTP